MLDSVTFNKSGKYYISGECMLFPSKDARTWEVFKAKKPKFDPNALQPFERVLLFNHVDMCWVCDFYSCKNEKYVNYMYLCVGDATDRLIPYNNETKHLVGT